MKKRVTPNNIQALNTGEVFVFGSNLSGHHAGGAARLAHERFGSLCNSRILFENFIMSKPARECRCLVGYYDNRQGLKRVATWKLIDRNTTPPVPKQPGDF